MKAVTLWQPWSTCIAHPPPQGAPKRIENRTWDPIKRRFIQVGELLAIHAGWRVDETAVDYLYMTDRLPLVEPDGAPVEFVHGAVEAVARLAGVVRPGLVPREQRCWVAEGVGPDHVCWLLEDVITLPEPVWCQGKQGLWTLDDDVELAVREQMARVA